MGCWLYCLLRYSDSTYGRGAGVRRVRGDGVGRAPLGVPIEVALAVAVAVTVGVDAGLGGDIVGVAVGVAVALGVGAGKQNISIELSGVTPSLA